MNITLLYLIHLAELRFFFRPNLKSS